MRISMALGDETAYGPTINTESTWKPDIGAPLRHWHRGVLSPMTHANTDEVCPGHSTRA